MPLYRDKGIVLRTTKLGEADRIVTILSQTRGKIRGVAKGVRKTKSKFGARLEPLSHVELQLYEGRGDLDTVTQAELIDFFPNLRSDLDRARHAMAIVEAADQLSQEEHQNARLYSMLLGALRELEKRKSSTIVTAFYFKALALEGFAPVFDSCLECGTKVDLVAYAVDEGGMYCREHRQGIPVSEDARVLIVKVLNGGLNEVLATEEGHITHEAEALATLSMEHHIERRLRALHVIDS